jgi:hypothetical protein
MHAGKLVFAQLTEYLALTTFRRCVTRYDGEHKIKRFTCLEQFLCPAFAQLTYRESLRDIEACLRALREAVSHGHSQPHLAQHVGGCERSPILPSRRSRRWLDLRSDDRAHGILLAQGISNSAAAHPLQRSEDWQTADFPDQQLRTSG